MTANPSGGVVTLGANGHITSKQSLDVATAGGRYIGSSNRGILGQIKIEQTANGADGGYIEFDTSPSGSTTPTTRMTIDSAGKIQIGNNIPMWSGSYGGALFLKGNNSTGDRHAELTTVDSNGASTGTGLVVKGAGSAINVGIGTTSPTFASGGGVQLVNSGFTSFRATSGSNTGVDFSQFTNGKGYVFNRDNADLIFGTNNSNRMTISSAGNLIMNASSDAGNRIQINGADETSEILEIGITSGHAQLTASHASGGSNTCGFIFRTRGGGSTVERMRISSDGIVTTPYQPRFKAYLNANTGATTFAATTVHRVPFASEHWDVGNNFNTSDYMFHAPVDGIYLFNVAVLLHSVSTGTSNCEISFRHENHATYYGQRVDASTGWGDGYVSLNATAHIKLDAGDTVSVKVYSTEAFGIYGNSGGASTYFSGVLEG